MKRGGDGAGSVNQMRQKTPSYLPACLTAKQSSRSYASGVAPFLLRRRWRGEEKT